MAIAIAGCGGGGGDDEPQGVEIPTQARLVAASSGSNVDQSNFEALGAPLASTVLAAAGSGLLDVTDLTGAARESAQSQAAATAGRPWTARWVARAAAQSATLVRGTSAAREQPQAVHQETVACSFGGSLTITVDDADGNDRLSPGDQVSLQASQCVEVLGDAALNGAFAMQVHAVELDSNQSPTALDVGGTFNQLSVEGAGMVDGGFRLWQRSEAAGDRLRLRFDGLTMATPGQTLTAQFDIVGLFGAAGGSFELQGGLAVGGQTYALTTGAPFAYAAGQPPHQGALRMRDAAGDAVELLARSGTIFDLGYWPSGATAAAAQRNGLRWIDFEP